MANSRDTNEIILAPVTQSAHARGTNEILLAPVTQSAHARDTNEFLLVAVEVAIPTPSLACPLVNTGNTGVAFTSTLQASGGVAPYTFAIIGGSLPPGLTLHASTGVIDGTPSASGSYIYTAQVTDTNGRTATATCSIFIAGGGEVVMCKGNITCRRITPHAWQGNNRVIYNRIEFEMARGQGTASVPNPVMNLSWSNDAGNTFNGGTDLPTGAVGQYNQRVYLNRCGYARDRVFQLIYTDQVYKGIVGAELDLIVAGS